MITHPFRDGAPFQPLIDTQKLFGFARQAFWISDFALSVVGTLSTSALPNSCYSTDLSISLEQYEQRFQWFPHSAGIYVHFRWKYRHYSSNRHYSARCNYWLFQSAPSDFAGTIAGNRHNRGVTSTVNYTMNNTCIPAKEHMGALDKKISDKLALIRRTSSTCRSTCPPPERRR